MDQAKPPGDVAIARSCRVHNDASSPVTRLLAESLSGQLSRRDIMKRAGALGLSAPLVGVMLSAQAHVAGAQDATPVTPGATITAPEGLPDLSGKSIAVIL